MIDLGQNEESEKLFHSEELYNLKAFQDSYGMQENLEKKYNGKLLIREIALFAGS